MSACSKCGNQDTKFSEGISKKTGKPWKGYKCECGNMDFVFIKAPNGNPAPTPQGSKVEKLLEEILKELKIANGSLKPQETYEDKEPF